MTSLDGSECPYCGENEIVDFGHSVACLKCANILTMGDRCMPEVLKVRLTRDYSMFGRVVFKDQMLYVDEGAWGKIEDQSSVFNNAGVFIGNIPAEEMGSLNGYLEFGGGDLLEILGDD